MVIGTFFKELRRRQVFRVAAVYIVGAWAVVQVADLAFPGLGVPDSAIRFVWMGVFFGFPLALVFGWNYEFSADGLVRTPPDDSGQSVDLSLNRKDFVLLSLLALAAIISTYELASRILGTRSSPSVEFVELETNPLSIAVLPFENRSPDADNAYFADGIHDDLLTLLSQLGNLKVISRTSVERFRKAEQSIPTISRALGVANVLEGAVQRTADRVRITVQLISGITDDHLWAKTYDRELTASNVFEIQSEVATAIANELNAELSSEAKRRLSSKPTDNLAAYEAFLLGNQRVATRNSEQLKQAVEYFQRAVTLDPNFALAYVGLADAYHMLAYHSGYSKKEMDAKGEAAVNRALFLDDRLGEAHVSLGNLKLYQSEYETSEAAFRKGLELNPNYVRGHQWYGNFLAVMGRHEEALREYESGLTLDPLSSVLHANIARGLESLSRYSEAIARFETLRTIDPGYAASYWGVADINWFVLDRLADAVVLYEQSHPLDPSNVSIRIWLGLLYLDLGDIEKAKLWIDGGLALGPESQEPNMAAALLNVYRGDTTNAMSYARKAVAIKPRDWISLALLRNDDLAHDRFDDARIRYELSYPEFDDTDNPRVDGSNFRAAIDYASVLIESGEKERATILLDRSLELIRTLIRLGWDGYWVSDAEIHALAGNHEKALDALEQAVDQGMRGLWWFLLKNEPNLDAIRGNPQYNSIIAKIETDMAAQLARVRELESKGQFSAQ